MVRADRGRGFRRLSAMFFAIVLAGSLSACASSNPTTPSATASTSAAATPPPSQSAAPSSSLNSSVLVSPPSKGSTAASGAAGVTTLTGTVAGGVESGCIVLTDDAGTVLANLMGLDTKAAPIGSKVQVTGEFETDMMTTCQQGKPFSVTDVQIQN
jgi:hypothetical protein